MSTDAQPPPFPNLIPFPGSYHMTVLEPDDAPEVRRLMKEEGLAFIPAAQLFFRKKLSGSKDAQ